MQDHLVQAAINITLQDGTISKALANENIPEQDALSLVKDHAIESGLTVTQGVVEKSNELQR